MFAALLILWIIFNGRLTLEIFLFGLVFSAAVFGFMCAFMDYGIEKEKTLLRLLPQVLKYIALLIIEIIKATFGVLPYIFGRKTPSPKLVRFVSPLKSNAAQVLLANSITLTPGTITAKLEDNVYTVHCLDASMGEGLEDCSFVRALKKMEEKL